MTTAAIITGVIMTLVFIIGLSWCFHRWRASDSEWED